MAHEAGDIQLWLAPTDESLCIVALSQNFDALGFACPDASQIRDGSAFLTLEGSSFGLKPGRVMIAGVLPDGGREATVVDANGGTHSVAVNRNAYIATLGAEPAELRWSGSDGAAHRVPLTREEVLAGVE